MTDTETKPATTLATSRLPPDNGSSEKPGATAICKTHHIIPDSEIERVHANANFGTMPKRQVVDQALLKTACGYSNGYTADQILAEHGLISEPTRRGQRNLTAKGRKYLWFAYGDQSI